MVVKDCFTDVRGDLDQQLMRIMNCGEGGNSLVPIKYDTKDPILYELPKTTFPVNAPLDSSEIAPGVRPTMQPAPGPVPVAPKTTATVTEKSGVMKWVEDNPMIAGGGLLVVLYLLSRRKKR